MEMNVGQCVLVQVNAVECKSVHIGVGKCR